MCAALADADIAVTREACSEGLVRHVSGIFAQENLRIHMGIVRRPVRLIGIDDALLSKK